MIDCAGIDDERFGRDSNRHGKTSSSLGDYSSL
jgi:hypothetical protein